MRATIIRLAGALRSLVIYWRPGRQAGLRRLYADFISPGDLAFDVGAHVGDRSVAMASLGARVIALEPQPQLLPFLRRMTRRHPAVTVLPVAAGSRQGQASLQVSAATPTVSSLSTSWMDAVRHGNAGFRGVRWTESVPVRVVTLDALIGEHGEPAFCKIDVEGFEAEVLEGLSRPLRALSFEFVPGAEGVADACIGRLEALGRYHYNVVLGEERHFVLPHWVDADGMLAWLGKGTGGRSGDVYARQVPGSHD